MGINKYKRYQSGLTINNLYPQIKGFCACGCGKELPKSRNKWFSNECNYNAYINFAVRKGDVSIIRKILYHIDFGACRNCGVISNDWEADHILPVSLGGGGCEITNYQTLCKDCHKQRTLNLYTMTNSQFEKMLDQVDFKPTNAKPSGSNMPYVTHEGIFKLGEIEIKVCILNTGERIIPTDELEKVFGFLAQ